MTESSIDWARRNVADDERRIAVQLVTLDALRSIGASVCFAEQLLVEMEISQSHFRSELNRLEQEGST